MAARVTRTPGRKTTPKVKDGRVQRKNRWERSEYLALTDGRAFSVIKHRAQVGYHHVLQLPEVYRFVELIPDWSTLSSGLSALALSTNGIDGDTGSHYDPSYRAIWMHPFPDSMETGWSPAFYEHHAGLVSQLGAAVFEYAYEFGITWSVAQAKAWQLLHLFLYELSVHTQFMQGGRKRRWEHDNAAAEAYAFATAQLILPEYERVFGAIE